MRQLSNEPTGSEIMEYIEAAMDARELANQLQPSPIAAHQHTGSDSLRVNLTDIVPFMPLKVTDATAAPTDTPLLGTFRFYYDATPHYRLWVYFSDGWHYIGFDIAYV